MPVVAEFPAGPGPFPTLVLAPGQRYPLDKPALAHTAKRLIDAGVAVYRFNWSYADQQPPGEPSADLSAECADFLAVLAQARAEPRVAAERLWVGGKSMGSTLAWRLLQAEPGLRGAVLLTPLCSRVLAGATEALYEAERNYPGLAGERRASLWIAGDHDPQCTPAALQRVAASAAGRLLRCETVGGNHSFEDRSLSGAAADAFRTRQVEAVAAHVARFVNAH